MSGSITAILIIFFIIFISIIFHEIAHGYVAYLFGDNTAKNQGRLTLNPFKHIDLFGTIILPLMLFYTGAPVIGWAKPVPINPYNLPQPKKNMIWIGAAGPLTNYTLAFLLSVLKKTALFGTLTNALLTQAILINLILGTFNLIPIPPLDGSRIVAGFLKGDIARKYDRLEKYGILIIFILAYLGILGNILNFFMPLFRWFLQ